jgi:glycerol uptake facilitator-like aquaporin
MGEVELGAVPLVRRVGAEILGTAALTFVATATSGPLTAKVIAPALVVGAMVFALGNVSGALINPAVTLAFALRRAFPWRLVPLYWTAQLVGCALAGVTARGVLGHEARQGIPVVHVEDGHGFVWEVLLTALLVLVILGTATKAHLLGPEAAIPVSGTLAVDGLLGGPFTGASMNPARALGPAWAFGELPDLSVYVVAPLVGAAAAVVLAFAVFGRVRPEERHAAMGDGA